MVKNLPALWETQFWFLGQEDPPEKRMATHSSILAWRIPRTEEPGGLQSMGSQREKHDWATNTFTFISTRLPAPHQTQQRSTQVWLFLMSSSPCEGSHVMHKCEKWSISCHILNKDITVISDYRPPVWTGEPWGHSWRKEYLPSSSHQTAATPSGEPRGNSGAENKTLAPDRWGVYQRNDFSEPRLLHLPIHRKVLSSLTRDIWFSLVNNTLLRFRLPALCCKTSIYLAPLTSLEQFSQGLLEMLSAGQHLNCLLKISTK